METVIDPIDAYVIEYEKCKVMKLCILDKYNEELRKLIVNLYDDEIINEKKNDEINSIHNTIYTINNSKYTYLQLVEEFKKLCKNNESI